MWSKALTVCVGLGVIAGGLWGVYQLWPRSGESAAAGEAADGELAAAASEPGRLRLPADKIAAAGVQSQPATARAIGEMATVPGRVRYDDRRHVEVRAAADGVVVELVVRPGDVVGAGAVLAVLSSPEVGAARADLLEREAALQAAEQTREWRQSTCESLEKLALAVRQRTSPDQIRRDFRDAPLGTFREQILSSYARYTLSEKQSASLQSVAVSGAVPQRRVEEAESERAAATATFDAILEQSLFDARQQQLLATNSATDAARRVEIARQRVKTLLGHVGEMPAAVGANRAGGANGVGDANGTGGAIDPAPDGNLSLVAVRAPFAGTIERIDFSRSERVGQGDTLMILADTSQLWVAADLREREWSACRLAPGDRVTIRFPALPQEEFAGDVYFVGREVDPGSNALPVMVALDNSDGRLRPGMYAEITLPLGPERTALAVPESALCEHQGERFVFLRRDETTFERMPVATGIRQAGWLEVVSGLSPGDDVVIAGAFQLKSELLLEREE